MLTFEMLDRVVVKDQEEDSARAVELNRRHTMPRGKMFYRVRKQFIKGNLSGLAFDDDTNVATFMPGRIYKSADGTGDEYLVLSVTPVYPC